MKLWTYKAVLHGIRKAKPFVTHNQWLVLSQNMLFLVAYMQQFCDYATSPSKCLIDLHQHTYKTGAWDGIFVKTLRY